MTVLVTCERLRKLVLVASHDDTGMVELRDFVDDFFASDEEYVFEGPSKDVSSEDLERIFGLLAAYEVSEDALGDPMRKERLTRVAKALRFECSAEAVVVAMEFEQIEKLLMKMNSGVIDELTLKRRLQKLVPVEVEWPRAFGFLEKHRKDLADIS